MCGDDLFLMSESKEGLLNMLDNLHVYCKSWNILVCPKIFMRYTYLWKKCNSKQWKGKYPRYVNRHTIIFHSEKNTGTKTNIFLTFFYNGKCIHLFSIRYSLLIPRYFNVIIRVLSIFFFFFLQRKMSVACLFLAVYWNLTS